MKLNVLKLFIVCVVLTLGCSPVGNRPSATSQEAQEINRDCPLSFPKLNLCGELEPESPLLVSRQDYRFHLRVWAKNPSFNFPDLTTLTPSVWPWMVMPGGSHGSPHQPLISPFVVENPQEGSGTYPLSNVFFSMSGKWEIHVAFSQNGITDEAIYKLRIK